MSVLVFIDHTDGHIKKASHEALSYGAKIAEQTGDRYRAGTTRFNMALMYLQSSSEEITDPGQRDLVLRARSYAAAALRDFQHYEGRAAADEANAQRLIDHIDAQLG